MENYQKYLNPQTLASLEGLDLQARLVVEGYVAGHAPQPVPRLLRRVRRAPRVRPGRRHPPRRLEGLVEDRQVLPQAVRGGDQPPPLPAARHQRVDGLRLGPERHEAPVRAVRRGRAGVHGAPAAGLGRPGDLRRRGPPLPQAGRPAVAPEGADPPAGRDPAREKSDLGDRLPRPGRAVQEAGRGGRSSPTSSTTCRGSSPGSSTSATAATR